MSDYLSMIAAASAATYDRYLGPWQFEPYALDVAGGLSDLTTGSLLETAAGTGVLTRVLTRMLPEAVGIVATALNQSRLDYAAAQSEVERVTWRQADALDLPFDAAAFDVVVCQFGVMFFPDKVAGYREVLRVLKPGGRFLFNVWDRVEAVEFTNLVLSALSDLFPQEPPRNLARTAFAYYQTSAIEDELREAGFRSIAVETVDMPKASETGAKKLRQSVVGAYCRDYPTYAMVASVARPGNVDQSGPAPAQRSPPSPVGDLDHQTGLRA